MKNNCDLKELRSLAGEISNYNKIWNTILEVYVNALRPIREKNVRDISLRHSP